MSSLSVSADNNDNAGFLSLDQDPVNENRTEFERLPGAISIVQSLSRKPEGGQMYGDT